jgi:hypothetical protein
LIFNEALLTPYIPPSYPSQMTPRPPPELDTEGIPVYEVEKIIPETEKLDEEPITLSSGKVTQNRRTLGNQKRTSPWHQKYWQHLRRFQDKIPRERVML